MKSSILCLLLLLASHLCFASPISKDVLKKVSDWHNINNLQSNEEMLHRFKPVSNAVVAYRADGTPVKLSGNQVYKLLYVIDINTNAGKSTWMQIGGIYPALYVQWAKMRDIEAYLVQQTKKRQLRNIDISSSSLKYNENGYALIIVSVLLLIIFFTIRFIFSSKRKAATHTSHNSVYINSGPNPSAAYKHNANTTPTANTNKGEWFMSNGGLAYGTKNALGDYVDMMGQKHEKYGLGWRTKK